MCRLLQSSTRNESWWKPCLLWKSFSSQSKHRDRICCCSVLQGSSTCRVCRDVFSQLSFQGMRGDPVYFKQSICKVKTTKCAGLCRRYKSPLLSLQLWTPLLLIARDNCMSVPEILNLQVKVLLGFRQCFTTEYMTCLKLWTATPSVSQCLIWMC